MKVLKGVVRFGCAGLSMFISCWALGVDYVVDGNAVPVGGVYYPSSESGNYVFSENFNASGNGVYGGYGISASNNVVRLSSVSALGKVFGGFSNSLNSVLINNEVYLNDSKASDVSGGYSVRAGRVEGNKAFLNFTDIQTSLMIAYGGFVNEGATGGVVNNNELTVVGGRYRYLIAGWSPYDVKNNIVRLEGVKGVDRVIGGWGSYIDGNSVVIIDSTVGDIYGGELPYPKNSSARATNSTVELRGKTVVYGNLYGGIITAAGSGGVPTVSYEYDIVTGNKLVVSPTVRSISLAGDMANFSLIEFDFSDFPDGDPNNNLGLGPAALFSSSGKVNLYPNDNPDYIANISITGVSQRAGRVNLINSVQDIVFKGGLQASEIPGLDVSYDFMSVEPGLSQDGKTLYVIYGLNWYFTDANAHGDFTLNDGVSYELGTTLVDVSPPANSAGWNGRDLTKKGLGVLILEEDNTYTGATVVEAGTLQIGNSEAVGSIAAASNVTIKSGGILAINRSDDFTLANAIAGVGAVTQMGAGQLLLTTNNTYSGGTNVNAGSLSITNLAALGTGEVRNSTQVTFAAANGSFTNTITGTGDVSFSGGSNVRLLAGITASDITIDAGSTAIIASTNPVEGNIVDNGVLAVEVASNYVLDGPISGTGVLEQNGSGQLLLTQTNSYSGGTNINAGTLVINNTGAVGSGAVNNNAAFMFSGASGDFSNPISGPGNVLFSNGSNINITGALGAGDVNIDSSSTAGIAAGQTWTVNNLNNAGEFRLVGDGVSATVAGNVTNSGQLRLDHDGLGSELSITGNYVGNNGSVWLNTQLDDDDSDHDLLKVTGTASGQTEVRVRNIDGEGSDALVGIRIIETGASARDTFFLKDGYVAAGAYDYSLFRREENAGVNWYLSNGYDEDGDGDVDPEAGPTYTPGLGSVIANTIAANSLFSMRFEDREGAGQSQLGNKAEDNVWVRYSGGNNKFRALNNQLHTSGHSSAMQVGVGLPGLLETHSIDLGVMAGYGHYKGNTKSSRTDRKSSSVVDGYSVGAYGTWYSEPASQSGVYVDSWLLWNHFDNRVKGADENTYKYKAKGITASIEVGKGFAVGELNGADIWMQPQAQVTYQGVRANTFKDTQDVTAKRGSDNVQLRAGVKTYADQIMLGNMSSRPFVEVNYIHNTDHYSTQIDDSTYRAAGGENIGEIRLGLEGNVLGSHQMWINTGYADGGKHYKDFSINAGWKYQF